jgi:heme-degrading monooxygenase HmoA
MDLRSGAMHSRRINRPLGGGSCPGAGTDQASEEPIMFAVIFEVQPKKECWDDYLELAKLLKPELEKIDGFIDNERFGSKRTEGRLLSLSTWRDEKAVIRWRTLAVHHGAQEKGRFEIFEDYHLRVGEITADSALPENLAIKEQRFDETEIGEAKLCTITEIAPATGSKSGPAPDALLAHLQLDAHAGGLIGHELFESIYTPGKLVILGSWRDKSAAATWTPTPFEGASDIRHRRVRVIRDYGMRERREAPQFYPAVGEN